MDVSINGEPHNFDGDELSVDQLLRALDFGDARGVAVALNFAVVPRSAWPTTNVSDGDEVELVRATQGG